MSDFCSRNTICVTDRKDCHMTHQADIPVDNDITIEQLTLAPYPIYRRLRAEAPVLKVSSVGRILLTKAADTKRVKGRSGAVQL